MTTHEDNSVCIDKIGNDLVHDGKRDFFVPAEDSEANGSGVGVERVFLCSELCFPCHMYK